MLGGWVLVRHVVVTAADTSSSSRRHHAFVRGTRRQRQLRVLQQSHVEQKQQQQQRVNFNVIEQTEYHDWKEEKRQRRQRRRRQLSPMDHIDYPGLLIPQPSSQNLAQGTAYWLIHTPKTAGDSILSEGPKHIPVGSTIAGNGEQSFYDTLGSTRNMIVFARDPTSHVISQFLTCKYSPWGRYINENTNFPGYNDLHNVLGGLDDWITYWYQNPYNNSTTTTTTTTSADYNNKEEKKQPKSLKCYNPWNHQSRHMVYNSYDDDESGDDENMKIKSSPHVVTSEHDRIPPISEVLQNLEQVGTIGIVEHFTASMCILEYHANQRQLTDQCTCTYDKEKAKFVLKASNNETRETHGVPKYYSTNMVTQETIDMIHQLTTVDQLYYDHAVKLFTNEIERIQHDTGIDLLCRDNSVEDDGNNSNNHGALTHGPFNTNNSNTIDSNDSSSKNNNKAVVREKETLLLTTSTERQSCIFDSLGWIMICTIVIVYTWNIRRRSIKSTTNKKRNIQEIPTS